MTQVFCNWPVPKTKYVESWNNINFDTNDIAWVCDTLTLETQNVLGQKNSKPKYIVNDNAAKVDSDVIDVYSCTFRGLELEFKKFLNCTTVVNPPTIYNFSFNINKKQINRYLLIKLVEHFKLKNFDYTWSGIGRDFDMSKVIDEWNSYDSTQTKFSSKIRTNMLSSIQLEEKFLHFSDTWDKNPKCTINNYGGNLWTWENIFCKMMSHCGVALIGESLRHEKSSVFTEKTLYALLALNFSIWIGGWGHADQLRRMGFDVFDDIIDHSYQYQPTLFERCYLAFANNLRLLTDLDYVAQLRNQHYHRLVKNRDLLFQGQLTKATNDAMATWPLDLQQTMSELFNSERSRYRNTLLGPID